MDDISGLIEGYKACNDLVKQLITLATGILALSITFTKDILKGIPQKTLLLKLSWLLYFLSLCFGMLSMQALAGMIFKVSLNGAKSVQDKPYGSSVLPMTFQIITFITGTILIISFGIKSLKSPSLVQSETIPPPDNSPTS
jgi:hypothetical protein